MPLAPIDVKQAAERRMRRLLDDAGLPAPDEVRYGACEIQLLWHDLKVAVVVELGEFEEHEAFGDYNIETLRT